MFQNKILHLKFLRFYSQSLVPVPVIKIPQYVKKHVEKFKTIQEKRQMVLRRKIVYRGNTSIRVISSNEGEYNHYLGQIYSERYPIPLLSKYWFKSKSSGQKFTIHRYDPNPSLPIVNNEENAEYDCIKEFSKLNLNATVCESLLKDFNFQSPTPIQVLAIPRILKGEHVLIAAETGCGKTIAYLAPMITNISRLKINRQRYLNSPLGLIIVPGRELAEQIGEVAYKLGSSSGISVKVLVSDGTFKKHISPSRFSDVDILVATIGSLSKLQNKVFKLSNLQHLVLDEADTLTDDSFEENLTSVMQTLMIHSNTELINGKKQGAQMTIVSSIYPSNISAIFSETFQENDIVKICSNYLHRILPHVEQKFWRVNNIGRAGELLYLVKSSYQKKEPTLVFCNKSPTCDWMEKYLEENGVPCLKLHGAMSPRERSKAFYSFQNGIKNILCCTDLASRGLDTQRARHVINFDFPNNTSDYILRCGRVGRVGTNHGHVTNLVVSSSGVHTVQDIETGVRSSSHLPNVDSNIKRKITKLYFTH